MQFWCHFQAENVFFLLVTVTSIPGLSRWNSLVPSPSPLWLHTFSSLDCFISSSLFVFAPGRAVLLPIIRHSAPLRTDCLKISSVEEEELNNNLNNLKTVKLISRSWFFFYFLTFPGRNVGILLISKSFKSLENEWLHLLMSLLILFQLLFFISSFYTSFPGVLFPLLLISSHQCCSPSFPSSFSTFLPIPSAPSSSSSLPSLCLPFHRVLLAALNGGAVGVQALSPRKKTLPRGAGSTRPVT